ncbi:MAG TPA: hypothetical protein VEW07_07880 [Solirubrobacterales bacterium]|nr:hypothetical protein [Solirubrobacterales bacterium]
MNGKFKAIGLALIAVLALSAFSATAAQGAVVTAGAYPATLTGKDVKTVHGELARLTIGNGARYIECENSTLSATISEAKTEVEITPTYSGCFSNGLTSVPSTVTFTCVITIHPTSQVQGQATIGCGPGSQIQVHVYENHKKHTENKPICAYDIAAQGPITGAKLGVINAGAANEGISVNLAELAKFNVTSTMGPLSVCGVNGTSGHAATTGSLRGEYHVTGKSGGVDTKVMLQ